MGHDLSFAEQDYDEFLMDIYSYSTSIISELQQQFPNRSLFTSMKILNPREWPKDFQDLLYFGDNELEDLLKYYEYPNIHNGIQTLALFDINKCRQEWAGFKMVVSNFSSKDIDIILLLLIQDYNDIFLNIIKLIQLIYCIPFSNIKYECGFSRQNQIKTKNRNSLTTDILDMLMHISLEEPDSSKFDYNHAYTIWNNQKKRISIKK